VDASRKGWRTVFFDPVRPTVFLFLADDWVVETTACCRSRFIFRRECNEAKHDWNSGLAASRIFLSAERDVPTARQAFTYIDPALIYTRLDATLRPILFMGAAFLPGISDTVDLNKLPPVEVITNHLTPIVMSQSYDGNGYIAESAGTITLGQAIIGVGGIGGFAGVLYQHQLPKVVKTPAKTPTIPAIGPTPSASTSDSSTEGESAESE
jgi:hypothetical protein